MASVTTTKIQITQGTDVYGIDRSRPAAIPSSMISKQQWDELCEQVDTIVLPLNKLRIISWSLLGLFLISFVVTVVVQMMSFRNNGSNSPTAAMSVFLFPVGCIIALIVFRLYKSHRLQNAVKALQKVCEETSQQYNNDTISLHMRHNIIVVPTGSRSNSTTTTGGVGTIAGGGGGGGGATITTTGGRTYTTYHDLYIDISIRQRADESDILELGGTAAFSPSYYHQQQQRNGPVAVGVVPIVEATEVVNSMPY